MVRDRGATIGRVSHGGRRTGVVVSSVGVMVEQYGKRLVMEEPAEEAQQQTQAKSGDGPTLGLSLASSQRSQTPTTTKPVTDKGAGIHTLSHRVTVGCNTSGNARIFSSFREHDLYSKQATRKGS